MTEAEPIVGRMAACRERRDDGKRWSYYLFNDGAVPLDSAVLYRVSYEWGDLGARDTPDVRVADLAPGAHALVWRDDGSGAEVRTDFSVRVRAGGREAELYFEFPKLYRRTNLPMVDALGMPAREVTAVGRSR